jgi:acyl-coenzyme A synthetase/AMP-(fatty) acid ligase
LAISAGAPLPVALEQAVLAGTGLKIHNFYGSTECGGIAYDLSNTPRQDEACVGGPMRGVELSLTDDGCLRVHGGAVGQTYWPEPEAPLNAGCFQTSDLAELKDGLVYLRGRLSEQINVAGRKVAPAAIEQVLRQHDRVRECLVFGVPSGEADRTEAIVACVAARAPVSAEELRHFLLSRLSPWQVPRQWCFVDSLEANQRGKISRADWRRRFLAGGL